MTGCGRDTISNRVYTRTIGIQSDGTLTIHARDFSSSESFSGSGSTAAQALRSCEISMGKEIRSGHTELLCLDGSTKPEVFRELLFEDGLPPACKVCFTNLQDFFQAEETAELQQMLLLAEQNGTIGACDLASILVEWLGSGGTALLPSWDSESIGMALLHRNGDFAALSEQAAQGMYWLRKGSSGCTVTLTRDDETKDVRILQSSIRRSLEDSGSIRLLLSVRSEDCPSDWRSTLASKLLECCTSAVSEMRSAGADVLGIEELLEAERLSFDPEDYPEIVIEVRIN